MPSVTRNRQSPSSEFAAALDDVERKIAKAEYELEVAKLAKLLLESYRKHGCMRVPLRGGFTMEAELPYNVHPIHHIWNVRSEAWRLAEVRTLDARRHFDPFVETQSRRH